MMAFSGETLTAILLIYLVGGFVKGVLGFGLPIITMALLPFVIGIQQAIVLSAIVQPVTNVFQLVGSGDARGAFRIAWPVLIALPPGILLGAWLLTSLDQAVVLLVVGITISLYALYDLSGHAIQIGERIRNLSGMAFGFIAGVFGALTSVNGWAFIIYLLGLGVSRKEFRSTIAILFLVSGGLISISFAGVGLLTAPLFWTGMIALVPSFAGMWIGNIAGEKIPAPIFRRGLLVALCLIGIVLATRGAGSIGQF